MRAFTLFYIINIMIYIMTLYAFWTGRELTAIYWLASGNMIINLQIMEKVLDDKI